MENPKTDVLYGLCPLCSGAESPEPDNPAFVSVTIAESDKDQELVWSRYYEKWVCRAHLIEGQDHEIDQTRNDRDNEEEKERQKMGYTRTYEPN